MPFEVHLNYQFILWINNYYLTKKDHVPLRLNNSVFTKCYIPLKTANCLHVMPM